jgi:hypothetical protein
MPGFAAIVREANAAREAQIDDGACAPDSAPGLDQCTVEQETAGVFDAVKRREDKSIEYGVMVMSFADGRSESEQIAIFDALGEKRFAPMVRDAMKRAISEVVDGFDPALPVEYYMLCQDEELGILDSGVMDGSPRLRCARASWRVVVIYTSTEMAVLVTGYPHDVYDDPVVRAYHNSGTPDWTQLYCEAAAEPPCGLAAGPPADLDTCSLAEIIRMIAELVAAR